MRLLAGVLVCCASVTAAPQAGAQTATPATGGSYAVDLWMRYCDGKANSKGASALAFSKAGVAHCATGSKVKRAKKDAERQCNKLVPRDVKKKAECQIVSTNEEILEPGFIATLQQDIVMPVSVAVFDGDTESTQKFQGSLVLGQSVNREDRRIRVLQGNGAEICSGRFNQKKSRIRYDLTCFSRFKFRDQKSRVDGYFLFNGLYAPTFEIELKQNKSFIKITPPTSD